MSLTRKHRIADYDLQHRLGPEDAKRFIIDRLVGAGFDLLRPIAKRYDIARQCHVYLQDPNGTLAPLRVHWQGTVPAVRKQG